MSRTTRLAATEKVKVTDLRVGDVVDFDAQKGVVPSYDDSRAEAGWEKPTGRLRIVDISVQSYTTMGNSTRAGRSYVLTFDNGRSATVTVQQKLPRVVSTKLAYSEAHPDYDTPFDPSDPRFHETCHACGEPIVIAGEGAYYNHVRRRPGDPPYDHTPLPERYASRTATWQDLDGKGYVFEDEATDTWVLVGGGRHGSSVGYHGRIHGNVVGDSGFDTIEQAKAAAQEQLELWATSSRRTAQAGREVVRLPDGRTGWVYGTDPGTPPVLLVVPHGEELSPESVVRVPSDQVEVLESATRPESESWVDQMMRKQWSDRPVEHCPHCGAIKPAAAKRCPSCNRKTAHDRGDNEILTHCVFCGGGDLTARSDGSAFCHFCNAAFTVQVQPQHPGMPQTVEGQPYAIPDMPEQELAPPSPLPRTQDPFTDVDLTLHSRRISVGGYLAHLVAKHGRSG